MFLTLYDMKQKFENVKKSKNVNVYNHTVT